MPLMDYFDQIKHENTAEYLKFLEEEELELSTRLQSIRHKKQRCQERAPWPYAGAVSRMSTC